MIKKAKKTNSKKISNKQTGILVLENRKVFKGIGIGYQGTATGEVCFNTSLTGYQEIISDPSYAGQIINFTFPHIGNVGVNSDDDETQYPAAEGLIVKCDPTTPSNWRALENLSDWLEKNNLIAMGGIDTRRLTRAIRMSGAPHVVLAHNPNGNFDTSDLITKANNFTGLEGLDLAKKVTCSQLYKWDEMRWAWPEGFIKQNKARRKVVAIDYGAKRNILRSLASAGCEVTVLPATSSAEEILEHNPEGLFLSIVEPAQIAPDTPYF